ncbi:MAG: patatin-like phospholipase family protein [Patescibacteria group bacterium]|jgi:NTE family protein
MDLSNQPARKKVGLAISGGFIRATAAIGVIEVLEENNIPIDIISGCSSGAAIAAVYAAGTLPELKKRMIAGNRRDYWRIIFEPTLPKEGFLKGEKNQKFFEEFVGDKEFCDLNKRLMVALTDLVSMEEVIVEQGKISEVMRAAVTVPGIFVPIKKDGKILIDGGNFNMIPSKTLYQNGADYVMAVYVAKDPGLITRFLANFKKLSKRDKLIEQKKIVGQKDLNIFQLVGRAISLSINQVNNFYHHAYPYDILIRPQIEQVKRYQTNSVAYCVEEGRKAALKALPQIKRDLGL